MRLSVLIASLFFLIFRINAQSLSYHPAQMSSYAKSMSFEKLGLADNTNLFLINDKGASFLYDGRSLLPSGLSKLKKTDGMQDLYFADSTLYFQAYGKYYKIAHNQAKPLRINKESIQLPYPRHLKANERKDKDGEFIVARKQSLEWWDVDRNFIASLPLDNANNIQVDAWNRSWFLQAGRLFYLKKNRSAVQGYFSYQAKTPQQMYYLNKSIYTTHDNRLIRWQNKQGVDLGFPGGTIKQVFYSSGNIFAVDVQKQAFIRIRDEWKYIDLSNLQQSTVIIQMLVHNDVVHVITDKEGILQAKYADLDDEFIWTDHRKNAHFKKHHLHAAYYNIDTLRMFTEDGVVLEYFQNTLRRRQLKKIGTPLRHVEMNKDFVFILDNQSQWYYISRTAPLKQKMFVQKLDVDGKNPLPSNERIVQWKNKFLYLSNDSLIQYRSGSSSPIRIDFPYLFKYVLVHENAIYALDNGGVIRQVLADIKVRKKGPLLRHVEMLTQRDVRFSCYPSTTETIQIEAEDLPLRFEAKVDYLHGLEQVEYAWSSEQQKWFDKSYSFKSEFLLGNMESESLAAQLQLKTGDVTKTYPLRSIKLVRTPEAGQNLWAIYLSAILGFLLLVAALWNLWYKRAQERKIKELMRTQRQMELEQKALQLQLNPHFIFNALNGVKGMIAMGDNKRARQYLTKISAWMRTNLHDARANQVFLYKEAEALRTYMEIEAELRSNFEFDIIIDSALSEKDKIPPMMIQPFIENAIVHAFNKIDYMGKIDLNFKKLGRFVQVSIEDNGTGLVNKVPKASKHKSVALELIRSRLKQMNTSTKHQAFIIKNKQEQDPSDHGVFVQILLPLSL